MTNRIALGITDFFLSKGMVKIEEYNICAYGVDLIISGILNAFFVILTGLMINKAVYALVCLIIMIVLRTFTGGYHANTHLGCNSVFIIVFLASVEILELCVTYSMDIIIWLLVSVGIILVAKKTPIKNKNKIVTELESVKYKKASIILYSVIVFVSIILNIIDETEIFRLRMRLMSLYININLIIVVIMMVIGEWKEGKEYDKKGYEVNR